MKLKKLSNTVKFNPAHKRYKGSRFYYYPIQDLQWNRIDRMDLQWNRRNRIGYAEAHYVHYPDYCNTIYYIR